MILSTLKDFDTVTEIVICDLRFMTRRSRQPGQVLCRIFYKTSKQSTVEIDLFQDCIDRFVLDFMIGAGH